jgi:hypothetical protein
VSDGQKLSIAISVSFRIRPFQQQNKVIAEGVAWHAAGAALIKCFGTVWRSLHCPVNQT